MIELDVGAIALTYPDKMKGVLSLSAKSCVQNKRRNQWMLINYGL